MQTITGTGERDFLAGGRQSQEIFALAGADIVYGDFEDVIDLTPFQIPDPRFGDDHMDGGSGNDVLAGDALAARLSGDAPPRSDSVYIPFGADTVRGRDGNDVIFGDVRGTLDNLSSNTAFGGANDIELAGGPGNDTIFGDAQAFSGTHVIGGDDGIASGSGSDTIFGDAQFLINDGTSTFVGGNDTIAAGRGDDTVFGDFRRGLFSEGNGPNVVIIGGDDQITGGFGHDNIAGDLMSVGGQANAPIFRGGDDIINGGKGDDNVVGDVRSVFYFTDLEDLLPLYIGGDDEIRGSNGEDFLIGDSETFSVPIANLVGQSAAFEFGDDGLFGGRHDDVLIGDVHTFRGFDDFQGTQRQIEFGDDEIVGGRGNDVLIGDYAVNDIDETPRFYSFDVGGNDSLNGGFGNDILFGQFGTNRLEGGPGDDLFVFTPFIISNDLRISEGVPNGINRIVDFSAGDEIDEIVVPFFDNLDELLSSSFQAGADVVIDLSDEIGPFSGIIIENVNVSELVESDFIFS